jgi:alcohol dehydrogenase
MMHQRSLLLYGPRHLAWVETELQPPGPGELLVRTIAGAISIGTELPLYLGISRGAHQYTHPLMSGYESLAEVIACGPGVDPTLAGARVIAFYGHRSAAIVRAERVVAVPAAISDALALLLILACDTAKGIARLAAQPDEQALITGAGAIGLLTLFNLCAQGLTTIDMIEPLVARHPLAQEIGARHVVLPQHAGTLAGYQCGFECSSRDAGFQALQQAMAPNGRICILADGNREPLTLSPWFHANELTVVGSSDGLPYAEYARWYWPTVATGRFPLERLFQRTIAAPALPAMFEELANGAGPVKVLVRYDKEVVQG